jgi:LmbE family N-acetylglucosaminyl deacetylase
MRKTGLVGRICQWGARRFLARLHRLTHRMPVELREVQRARVLVVAPHLDDEVIAPGGTLLLHRQAGSTVGVIFTSDSAGDPSQTGTASETAIRKREAEQAARIVGLEILKFLDYPDGQLSRCEAAMARDLAVLVRDWKPEQIFCPFPGDHHRDHQATTAAVAEAIRQTGWDGEVWCYEVWSTLWPNRAVDISAVVEKKREAIRCYASQVANMSYVEAALGLNRYRGLRVHVDYAEGFYVCPAGEFLALAQTLFEV